MTIRYNLIHFNKWSFDLLIKTEFLIMQKWFLMQIFWVWNVGVVFLVETGLVRGVWAELDLGGGVDLFASLSFAAQNHLFELALSPHRSTHNSLWFHPIIFDIFLYLLTLRLKFLNFGHFWSYVLDVTIGVASFGDEISFSVGIFDFLSRYSCDLRFSKLVLGISISTRKLDIVVFEIRNQSARLFSISKILIIISLISFGPFLSVWLLRYRVGFSWPVWTTVFMWVY